MLCWNDPAWLQQRHGFPADLRRRISLPPRLSPKQPLTESRAPLLADASDPLQHWPPVRPRRPQVRFVVRQPRHHCQLAPVAARLRDPLRHLHRKIGGVRSLCYHQDRQSQRRRDRNCVPRALEIPVPASAEGLWRTPLRERRCRPRTESAPPAVAQARQLRMPQCRCPWRIPRQIRAAPGPTRRRNSAYADRSVVRHSAPRESVLNSFHIPSS